MSLADDLTSNVAQILSAKREARDGRVVPTSTDVKFLAAGVALDAVFLYADLRDSTSLATKLPKAAADVFQCFLSSMARIIRDSGGEIRSFDGDRVMAVFIGPTRCDDAVRCGLRMNWAFSNIIEPNIMKTWPKSLAGFTLDYCTGIDSGEVLAVRGGVRNNSDLVWVGRAPNLAAKLSSMKSGYRTYITDVVFSELTNNTKYLENQLIWEARSWNDQNGMRIYCSNYSWTIR